MRKPLLLAAAGLLATALNTQAQDLTQALRAAHWPTGLAAEPGERPTVLVSQLQEMLVQNASGSSWVNYARDAHSRYTGYNADLPQLTRNSRWAGGAWVTLQDTKRRFSATGKLLNDTLVSYQLSPAGQPYFADVNRYNAADQLIEEKRFSGTFGSWDELKRFTHSYNASGQLTQTLEDNVMSGTYDLASRRTYGYDAQGRRNQYEDQTPDGSGGWSNLRRVINTFSSNATGNVETAIQELALTGGPYANYSRQTLQYNAQGQAQSVTVETWQNNAWQNYSLTTYTYDALGNPSMAVIQAWNGNAYQNYQRVMFTYQQVTGTQSARALAANLTVAPNPAATFASVRYELPQAGKAAVEVLDLTGRRVAQVLGETAQPAGAHQVELPVARLAAGVYLVRLRVDGQTQQTKLLVP